MAEQENLGSWLVTVVPLRSMKELEPEIEALIREGREVHPGQYRVADLLSLGSDQERQEFVAWHERLKDLGLVGIQRLETRVENGVWFAPMSGVRMIGGFSEALQATEGRIVLRDLLLDSRCHGSKPHRSTLPSS